MNQLLEAIRKASRVYICGNGGSAANSNHLANDLISVGVRAYSLTADVATLTALANDFSYAEVFSRQLKVLAEPGDLLICLSGSGNSENILIACMTCTNIGVLTCGIFGAFNNIQLQIATNIIIREGDNMQAAEEAQLVIGHKLMWALKENK